MKCSRSSPAKAAKAAMKCKAAKAMKAAKVAMKAECSKLKKAMKAVECLKATQAKMDEMTPLDLEQLAKAANEGQELGMWVDLGKERDAEIRTLGATLIVGAARTGGVMILFLKM